MTVRELVDLLTGDGVDPEWQVKIEHVPAGHDMSCWNDIKSISWCDDGMLLTPYGVLGR